MSINKIHINSSTNMTLNDRFTVMRSNSSNVKNGPRNTASKRISRVVAGSKNPRASFANRRFLGRLEQNHKIQTALKIKRRSLKAKLPERQRFQNRIGNKRGRNQRRVTTKALRLTPNGKLVRANSLSNIATMKADLFTPGLKRSNSNLSLSSRLGNRGGANSGLPRRQLRRSTSKQRITRSRSTSNLRRSRSRSRVRENNLNNFRKQNFQPSPKSQNWKNFNPINRPQRRSSTNGRINRLNTNIVRRRLNLRNNANNVRGTQNFNAKLNRRNSRGTVGNKREFNFSRPSRSQQRRNSIQQQRRSRSRSRAESRVGQNRRRLRSGTDSRRSNQPLKRGRSRSRSRNQRNQGQKQNKQNIKKEDLDKELDQYM